MNDVDRLSMNASLEPYIRAAFGRKAEDIVALYVQELTSIADVFVICSGRSSRQVSAIAEYIELELKRHDIRPLSVEGKKEGQWALLDYGHVIIHVFYEPVRQLYDLEGLWIDAKKLDISGMAQSDEDGKADQSL